MYIMKTNKPHNRYIGLLAIGIFNLVYHIIFTNRMIKNPQSMLLVSMYNIMLCYKHPLHLVGSIVDGIITSLEVKAAEIDADG